jgi:hypothetical protein
MDEGEQIMLDETNRMRAAGGRKPLSFDAKGTSEAKRWSFDQCAQCVLQRFFKVVQTNFSILHFQVVSLFLGFCIPSDLWVLGKYY